MPSFFFFFLTEQKEKFLNECVCGCHKLLNKNSKCSYNTFSLVFYAWVSRFCCFVLIASIMPPTLHLIFRCTLSAKVFISGDKFLRVRPSYRSDLYFKNYVKNIIFMTIEYNHMCNNNNHTKFVCNWIWTCQENNIQIYLSATANERLKLNGTVTIHSLKDLAYMVLTKCFYSLELETIIYLPSKIHAKISKIILCKMILLIYKMTTQCVN